MEVECGQITCTPSMKKRKESKRMRERASGKYLEVKYCNVFAIFGATSINQERLLGVENDLVYLGVPLCICNV